MSFIKFLAAVSIFYFIYYLLIFIYEVYKKKPVISNTNGKVVYAVESEKIEPIVMSGQQPKTTNDQEELEEELEKKK